MDKLFFVCRVLTFPGVLLKKAFESLLCHAMKIRCTSLQNSSDAFDSRFHIAHGDFESKTQTAVFCFVPTVLCLAMGVIFFLCGFVPTVILGVRPTDVIQQSGAPAFILYIFFFWLGISLLSNAFPKYTDARSAWKRLMSESGLGMKILFFLPCLLLNVGAFIEKNCISILLLCAVPAVINF